jgi:polar amino acid transport system ATP-binding protein
MIKPVLEVRGVTKEFDGQPVLKGIDLTVHEHQAFALIGASGSGKSTLLRAIDLLVEIDDGDILLDGNVITDPSVDSTAVRRKLGVVFQAFNLFPHLTVLENIVLGPVKAHGISRRQAEADALELLARFGLADRANERPDRMSGGQQQRVAIIRALAGKPRALLLDEVTSALDPELVGEVLDLVGELKAEGMTMLITTHEMSFAREFADQVCFLSQGRIVEQGTPDQIFESPEQPETERFLQRHLELSTD